MTSDIGFAVTTNLDKDGIRNFSYFLTKELQELIRVGMSFSQMMKPQTETQGYQKS